MDKIIGIDLGTTNSCVAVVENNEPKILNNNEGGRTTPSVIAITDKDKRLTGVIAKRQAVTNAENTVFAIKRLIGRKFNDTEVQKTKNIAPFKIVETKENNITIEIKNKNYNPIEISSMILNNMKQIANDHFNEEITDAVITVPAYFNDNQRQATKDAGEIAGLNVLRIINEPTAAALAYGLDKKPDEKIVVFDLGGGTFDISVLEIGDGVFEVKSTNGDTFLGGEDFDIRIVDWLVDEFKKEQGIDLKKDQIALQRLKESAEKAKCELSTIIETDINLPFITAGADGPKHLATKITRSKFESLVEDLINKVEKPCRTALEDAGLTSPDISEVLLVGGMARMPKIQEKIEEIFSKKPNKEVNPDEVVAIGASIQGAILKGDIKDVVLLDVTPLSLGIETLGQVMTKLIEKNSTIPIKKEQTFTTATDNQNSVTIHVLQGEREMAYGNKTIGRFELVGIPPAIRGIPQIEVSFDIDVNGILNVTAKDLATNKEQSIKIQASSGLSDEEIDKMKKDAELHAEEDKKQKELVEVKNQTSSLIYSVEKSLEEFKDDVDEETEKTIKEKIEELNKLIEGDDIEVIKKVQGELMQSSQKLSELMYKKNNPDAQTNQPNSSANPQEDNNTTQETN